MTRTKALFWKEWYEVRGFFVVALFVFLGLPLIGAAEDLVARQRFELSAAMWVFALGGLLAVFIGVGTVVRDLNGKLEEFWRSRPVSVSRWLIVKYFTGLALVLAALAIPLLVEMAVNRKQDEIGVGSSLILAWHPFFWAAAYSIAFALASLVRRGAHAAMLAISALLLLYFLPLVIPPLRFLSLSWVIDQSASPQVDHHGRILAIYHRIPWAPSVLYRPGQLWFVAGMVALCAIALAISVIAVRRDWRVESGQKTMYWSIGGAILLVFCSAAFQVASNLSILQTIDLPPSTYATSTYGADDEGVMEFYRVEGADQQHGKQILRTFRVTSSGIELGPGKEYAWIGPNSVWVPGRPDVLYNAGAASPGPDGGNYPILATTLLREEPVSSLVQRFPELAEPSDGSRREWWGSGALIWQGRLYVAGPKLLTFDLSDPTKPRLSSVEPLEWMNYSHDPQSWRFLQDRTEDVAVGTLKLPDIGPLPPRQRLEMAIRSVGAMLSGDILIRFYDDHITTYRISQLTESSVTFQRLGRHEPTILQRLIGRRHASAVTQSGLLFEVLSNDAFGGAHIDVLDVTGSRPTPIAHFALPHEPSLHAPYALPDGRLIVSGYRRIYLLSPPPRR
jgi:hypothetical protein